MRQFNIKDASSIMAIKKKKHSIQNKTNYTSRVTTQISVSKSDIKTKSINQNNQNIINLVQNKKIQSKQAWYQILSEVQELKKKLIQFQNPNNNKMKMEKKYVQDKYCLEQLKVIYDEVVLLRKQNECKDAIIKQLRIEIEYERKQCIKLHKMLMDLKKENEKTRDELLGGYKFNIEQRENRQKLKKLSILKQNKKLRQSISNLQKKINDLNPKNTQNFLKNDQFVFDLIDHKIQQLNQKFQILLFNSKFQKSKQAKHSIKSQIFTIAQSIKQLQNQKLQYYL